MITDYMTIGKLRKGLGNLPQTAKLATLAMPIPSQLPPGSAEKFDWLGTVPMLKRWTDRREAKKIFEHAHRVVVDLFESTIDMPKDWFLTDKSDSVNRVAGELLGRVPQHEASLIADLINAAETGIAFDGKAFFAADHSWGKSGTINNLISRAITAAATPTELEFAESIVAAIERLTTFKDDQGEPMQEEIGSILVVVGPEYGAVARRTLNPQADQLSDGVTEILNPVRSYGTKISLAVSQRITISASSKFDVYRDDGVPFAMLHNASLDNVSAKGEGSEYEHDTRHRQFGLEVVKGAGYARFTDGVRVTHTTA